jgi:hypothetical protein
MTRPVSANLTGTDLSRFLSALCIHRGVAADAERYARQKWPDSPAVAYHFQQRTVVEAGDLSTTGWASQLAGHGPVRELIQFIDGVSVFGRLAPSMIQVPFRTPVAIEESAPSAAWVGEAQAKPVSSFTFGSNVTLEFYKLAVIVVLTSELVRFITEQMGVALRNRVVNAVVRTVDSQFLSPSVTAVAGVRPSSITAGATEQTSSGSTAAQVLSDLTAMAGSLASWTAPFFVLSPSTAAYLAGLLTTGGSKAFPEITVTGGRLLGVNVITSTHVTGLIVLLDAATILYARDAIAVNTSDEAFIEMDDSPVAGETSPVSSISVVKSLFQNNLFAVKCEQGLSYSRTNDESVTWMSVNY